MYVTPEQVVAANKTNVEAWVGFANTNFATFEKLCALNFNATKGAFEDAMAHTKSVLNVKDVQGLVSLNAAATQPALEKTVAYTRSLYEVATRSQADMTRFLEAQASDYNKNVIGFLNKFSKNAPAGSDVAVAAVRSALAAANSAYDSLSKVAKQATEIAEANFETATTAVTKEIKAVTKKVA